MQADFKAINAGFMTKARTLTEYFKQPFQVTDNDADVNRGAKYYLITRPGAAPIATSPTNPTKKIYYITWGIVFDLQVKYKEYKESWNEFATIRDSILNLYVFTEDKTIPGVKMVKDVMIVAPEPPGQKPPDGVPTWVGQQLICNITQEINTFVKSSN